MSNIKKVGNVVGGGKSQGGSVFLSNGISPTLLSGMSHGNTVPYLIEIKGVIDGSRCIDRRYARTPEYKN